MKAVQISGYGGKEVTTVVADAPTPQLKDDFVLVKTYQAAINPVDWKMRAGSMKAFLTLTFPTTIGSDFSGVVEAVGPGVTEVVVGDAVFGSGIPSLGGSGTLAEYVLVPKGNLTQKPAIVSHAVAAAVVSVGVCAYLGVVEEGHVSANDTVLVQGGVGGIGALAIQLAKSKGAYVATTVSGSDRERATELGADLVLDYARDSFETQLTDYDLVIDTVGGETYTKSFAVLRKGGLLVSFVEQPNTALMEQYGVRALFILGFPTTERLEKVADLVANHLLTPHISQTFSLDEGPEALDFQQNGKPKGKIVIDLDVP